MFTTALISFREFLEAFIILGALVGASRSLKLREERSILMGGVFGTLITLTIAVAVFVAGSRLKLLLGETQRELFEGAVMVVSGLFLGLLAVSLHSLLHRHAATRTPSRDRVADFSFMSSALLVTLREGMEIALFTAAPAMTSTFIENLGGLGMGLVIAGCVGGAAYALSLRFPHKRLFRFLEWLMTIMGSAFLGNGLLKLIPGLSAGALLGQTLPLPFLPDTETFPGHFFKSLTGLSRQTEVTKLAIMAVYIIVIRYLTIRSYGSRVDEEGPI